MRLQGASKLTHRHVVALFMALVMVFTMSGVNGGLTYVNAAAKDETTGKGQDGSSIITMGDLEWKDSSKESYTFPNADVSFTEDQLIFSISVDNGGYFIVPNVNLGTTRTLTGVKYDGSTTSYTGAISPGDQLISMTFTGTTPADKIKEYLRGIVFYRNGVDGSVKQKISVVANQIDLGEDMCAVAIDGKLHYYKYVTPGEGEDLLDWYAAYKASKESTFNGMHGYLATITMDSEQKYIYAYYNDIGHAQMQAWIGGLKTKLTNITSSCWDAAEFNPDWVDLGVIGSTKNPVATDWYWANGPEAGQTFYITNSQGKRDGAPGSEVADIQYNGWASGEPDNSHTSDVINHPTHQEYVTEYGYAENGAWNDYGAYNLSTGMMKGYIVEYSPYKNDEAHGGQEEKEEKESSSVMTIVTADDILTRALKEVRLSNDKVKVDETIYVSLVRDEDGENLDLTEDVKYQWQYMGEDANWHDYIGENSQGYTPKESDIGKFIRCKVEAKDPEKYTGTVYAGTKDGTKSGEDTPGILVKTNKDPSVTIHPTSADEIPTPELSYPDGNTDPSDDTAFSGEQTWLYNDENIVKERKIIEVYSDTVSLNPEFDPAELATNATFTKLSYDVSTIDKDGGKYTVSNLNMSNPSLVQITYKDEEKGITYYMIYKIIRKDINTSTGANVSTNLVTPTDDTDQSTISDPDTSVAGKKKYVITVPFDQTSVEIDTTAISPAILDETYGTNGVNSTGLTSPATLISGSTSGAIKVSDLAVGSNGTICVQVKSQDGLNTTVYEYEIVRKADTTSKFDVSASNETDPTGVTGPNLDTSASEGNHYVYNITLDADVDSATLKPDMNNVSIESITKNGTEISPKPADGVVTVTDVAQGEAGKVTIKYTVKDTTSGTISTYTYIITRNTGLGTSGSFDIVPTNPNSSNPSDPASGVAGPGADTGSGKDHVQEIHLDSNVPSVKLTPDMSNVTIESIEKDGTPITPTPEGGIYTVDVDPGEEVTIKYTIKDTEGNPSTYTYVIDRANGADATPDVEDQDPSTPGIPKVEEGEKTTDGTTTTQKVTITVPADQKEVTIYPNPENGAKIDTSYEGAGVKKTSGSGNVKENKLNDSTKPAFTIDNLTPGDGNETVVSVKINSADGKSSTIYEYTIVREAKTSITPVDPEGTDTDKIEEKQDPDNPNTTEGTTKRFYKVITVPYAMDKVQLVPNLPDGATVVSITEGGVDKTSEKTADNKYTVNGLETGTDKVVVYTIQNGADTEVYQYTITREAGNPVVVTPSTPDQATTDKITGPTEDTDKSTATDKYYDVKLPNGTDSVTMTPTINDGDEITSVTVDGTVVTIPENGTYTVTGVTTDQPKEIVYTVKDPSGNETKYHYTISQETKKEDPKQDGTKQDTPTDKKDPAITDITVKTDDNVATPADVTVNNNGTDKTITITVPSNQTDYTFVPEMKDPSSKITEVSKISGPAEVITSSDGTSFTAKGLDYATPTVVKITSTSSSGDTVTYTVTIYRAEEGVTPDISIEMNGGSVDLNDYLPDDVKKNAKEILYHCCAHTVLAIDKDGTVRSIGRSNKYKSSLVHVIVKGQNNKWTDYTIYIKVNGATKKEEYGTLVDYKGLNYELTGDNTCRVSSWKTNYNTKKKNIVIPDTIKVKGKTYKVTAIAPGAFMRNSKIVTIKIGKNVKEIGNTSFVGLRKLKKFTINKKNKYLKVAGKSGNKAKMILSKNGKTLYSMTNMQGSVTIPKSVTHITEYAGAGNVKMTKLIIPASVKRIDPCAFAHAKKMTYVQFKGKLPEMGHNCIVDQMNYKKGNVYVPKKYYSKYKAAFQKASKKRYGIKQFPAMSHLKKK